MAVDYFDHTSERERKEFYAKFYKEQPCLAGYIKHMLKDRISNEAFMKCEDMYMIVYRSYQYYGFNMAIIQKKIVAKQAGEILKLIAEPIRKPDAMVMINGLMKNLICQDHLLDYVFENLIGTKEKPVLDNKTLDLSQVFMTQLMVIYVLDVSMKYRMRNEK